MCPHGFDPEETGKREKQLSLTISASNGAALQGKLVLTFHSHSVELEAPLEDVTSDACTQIFRRFQNFGDVVSLVLRAVLCNGCNGQLTNPAWYHTVELHARGVRRAVQSCL